MASSLAAHRANARDRSVTTWTKRSLPSSCCRMCSCAAGISASLLGWRAGRPLGPVEAVHHVAGDLVLLQHHGDGLRGVDARLALAAALGVGRQRLLQLVGQAQVIHHQPAGLVAEDAVHAGDGLHQAVPAHRLVDIHRVQAGRVEAGQPHVAHDDDPERVFAVLEPLRQFAALSLLRMCCCHQGRRRRCRSSRS